MQNLLCVRRVHMMSLGFDFSASSLFAICCDVSISGRLISHGWFQLLLALCPLSRSISLGLICLCVPIYEPQPDIHSALMDLGLSGSPLPLSVLIYKIDTGTQVKLEFRDLVILSLQGLQRERDVFLAFRKRVAKAPFPSHCFNHQVSFHLF